MLKISLSTDANDTKALRLVAQRRDCSPMKHMAETNMSFCPPAVAAAAERRQTENAGASEDTEEGSIEDPRSLTPHVLVFGGVNDEAGEVT